MNELEEKWKDPFYSSFTKTLSFAAITNLKAIKNDKEREYALIYVRDWLNKRIDSNTKQIKISSKDFKKHIKQDMSDGLNAQDIADKYNKSLGRIQHLITEIKKEQKNDKR